MLLKPIKSTTVVDPRDRKHAIMLQRDYQKQMVDQLAGVRGNQGGLGEMATPIYRQQTMPNAAALPMSPMMMQQPQASYQDPNAQMAMMQQMMMMQQMYFQQQQLQQQQLQQQRLQQQRMAQNVPLTRSIALKLRAEELKFYEYLFSMGDQQVCRLVE